MILNKIRELLRPLGLEDAAIDYFSISASGRMSQCKASVSVFVSKLPDAEKIILARSFSVNPVWLISISGNSQTAGYELSLEFEFADE